MNDMFQCGDKEALVAFLYEECEPRQREVIAAHLARCVACAEEFALLGATRTQLAWWTPPAGALGFRIDETERPQASGLRPQQATAEAFGPRSDASETRALRPGAFLNAPAPWWQRPLPAWAQAAAAALIFASGMMLGAARESRSTGAATQVSAGPGRIAAGLAPAAPGSGGASLADLAGVEERLRAVIAQLPTASASPAAARGDDQGVIQRVERLLGESEERQRQELAFRTAALARDFDLQRRVDFQRVQQTMGQFQGTTGAEVREQREAIRFVMSALQAR